MAAVDTQAAYDIPALDFFHLPFESDLPQDILEVGAPAAARHQNCACIETPLSCLARTSGLSTLQNTANMRLACRFSLHHLCFTHITPRRLT
jgi:hypothetical protein